MTAQARIAPESLGDGELARLCALRDPDALRHVITANNQRLFRAAWSILRDRSEAEEAVQSAYLKAFANIGEFEGRSALSTWFTRIAINEALGRLRSNRRRQKNLEDQGVSVLETYREMLMRGSEPVAPDAGLAREQLRHVLERAVAGLPDAFRAVFVLRDVEGLSTAEAGEALGLREEAVKTRLHRARAMIRKSITAQIGTVAPDTFHFHAARCNRVVNAVLERIKDSWS
jgi:RNA polymerase sigma-70 factor (ECF subfamily)